MVRSSLLLVAALTTAGGALAGAVEVRFIEPDKFADARDGMLSRENVLKTLEERLKKLGEKELPASQTLQVEVLDIDLAGDAFPRVALRDTRVLRGRADWPSIQLRYTLREGDKVLKSGEDRLTDMNYLMHSLRASHDSPLPYEKRMLDHWFRDRILASNQGRSDNRP
jgi:hypothetical protein